MEVTVMGSSGSGSFGNYKPDKMKKNKGTGRGQGFKGLASGDEIECPPEITLIRLEDVQQSEYFIKHGAVPPNGVSVFLSEKLHFGRLVVVDSDTNEIIGNLPTQYNFLLNCLNSGKNYTGNVVNSDIKPVPYVVVTLHV